MAQIGRPLASKRHAREAFVYFPNSFYSITYVDRPIEHFLAGHIEARKVHKDVPNRARAPEIEPVQAAQS